MSIILTEIDIACAPCYDTLCACLKLVCLLLTLIPFSFLYFSSGWNLRCMDSGNMHHFVGADSSCISWGHAQYGELGYGPYGQKYETLSV